MKSPEKYETLLSQLNGLTSKETDRIANLGNISSLLFSELNLLWAGFYIVNQAGTHLVLGPFNGHTACTRIEKGKGVCGTSWAEERMINVDDVSRFTGYIACGPSAVSEIVFPIKVEGKIVGVLDLDTQTPNAFDRDDEIGLGKVVELIEKLW